MYKGETAKSQEHKALELLVQIQLTREEKRVPDKTLDGFLKEMLEIIRL